MRNKRITLIFILLLLSIINSFFYYYIGSDISAIVIILICISVFCLINFEFGLFSPIGLVVTFSLIYLVTPAIGFAQNNIDYIADSTYFIYAYPLSVSYILAIVLTTSFYNNAVGNFNNYEISFEVKKVNNITLLLIVSSLLLLYFSYHIIGIGRYSRAEIQLITPLAIRLLSLFCLCQVMVYFMVVFNNTKNQVIPQLCILFFCVSIIAISIIIIQGDRRIVLATALAILSTRKIPPRVCFLLLLMAIPLYFGLSLQSRLRNYPPELWVNIISESNVSSLLDINNSEFTVWTKIAQDLLPINFADVFKPTILTAPFSVIPHIIFPNRPDAASVWYVSTFYPDYAASGGGMAFSIVVESYLNFYILGPFLFGIIFGYFLFKAQFHILWRLVAVFTLVFSFRCDVVSLLQLCFWNYSMLKFLFWIGQVREQMCIIQSPIREQYLYPSSL